MEMKWKLSHGRPAGTDDPNDGIRTMGLEVFATLLENTQSSRRVRERCKWGVGINLTHNKGNRPARNHDD
jgi:hypothetical protein